MNQSERNEHELMTDLGLPDFETGRQCSDRQRLMARRFQNTRQLPPGDWQECDPEQCECTPCRDGCWFASRHHRYQTITEAHRLLSTQTGDLYFVTVAHPKWERPIGKLDQANITAVRQWLYRRFKRLDKNVVAVGGFEASLNVDLDGTTCWAGHVHLVVAGSDKPSLKKALQIEKHHRSRPYARPVDVRDVDNLGRRLG